MPSSPHSPGGGGGGGGGKTPVDPGVYKSPPAAARSERVVAAETKSSPSKTDPYRFTRSTAKPYTTGTLDRAKLSDLSAKYRY